MPLINDDFRHGIWWRPVSNGMMRPATGQECATEIQRLRWEVARLTGLLLPAGAKPAAEIGDGTP